jgi:hypothetical protein
VLAVDEKPVEAARLGELGGVDGAGLAQAKADGELAGAQLAQGVVRYGAQGSSRDFPKCSKSLTSNAQAPRHTAPADFSIMKSP